MPFTDLTLQALEEISKVAAFLLTPGTQLVGRPDVAAIGPPDRRDACQLALKPSKWL